MNLATKALGAESIKDFLKEELKKFLKTPFVIMYYDKINEGLMFKVILDNNKNNKEFIFVNDFGIQADFLYDDEYKVENKWLQLVSNKYKQMGKDYLTEYKKYATEQYKLKLEKDIKNFEKRYYDAYNYQKNFEM